MADRSKKGWNLTDFHTRREVLERRLKYAKNDLNSVEKRINKYNAMADLKIDLIVRPHSKISRVASKLVILQDKREMLKHQIQDLETKLAAAK